MSERTPKGFITEAKVVSGDNASVRIHRIRRPASGSSVEDQICSRETVRELGEYISTLTDAEILVLHAQFLLHESLLYKRFTTRIMKTLGVDDRRIMEIREEMQGIVIG